MASRCVACNRVFKKGTEKGTGAYSMKNKLTAIQVKKAGDGVFLDGGGLRLVRKDGRGKWVYRYTFGGSRQMGLGTQDDVSLAEARKERDRWAQVLAEGKNPIDVRKAEKEAQREEAEKDDPKFRDLAKMVFEARKAKLRGGGTRGRWFSPIEHYINPAFGHKPISTVTKYDVRDALKKIWKSKHPTAQKAIQRTRIIFRQGRLMGYECDPFTVDAAQAMLGEVIHKVQHHPAIPWQDAPAVYAALVERGNLSSALGLRLAFLTVVREDGIRKARFEEFEDGIWTVPADRVKGQEGSVEDFRVPLIPEAQAIVESAREYSSDYLFPGHRGKPITDVGLNKELKKAYPGVTVHGLRSTFKTWVQDTQSCSYEVSETALGHKIGSKVERSYARSDLLELRRKAMQDWADYLTGKVTYGADVVPIFDRAI